MSVLPALSIMAVVKNAVLVLWETIVKSAVLVLKEKIVALKASVAQNILHHDVIAIQVLNYFLETNYNM